MSSGNDQNFDSNVTRRGQLDDGPGGRSPAARAQSATRPAATPGRAAATASSEVGQAVSDRLCELVVSCDAAPALLQQFDHAQPEFIAVHDVGTATSRKLLAGVAEISGLVLKQLVIRRQGYGNTLATLEFLEFVGAEGGRLRVYSTDTEADPPSRVGLARVLLAYSRLGVLIVGELGPQALASAFKPLRDAITTGPWPNRDLLLLPLASSAALASQGSELGRGTGVTVRTTPAALRPADAWTFISGAWNRQRTQLAATGTVVPALGLPTARPAAVSTPAVPPQAAGSGSGAKGSTPRPPPAAAPGGGGEAPEAAATAALMTSYVGQLRRLTGVIDCCVFEAASGRSVAHLPGAHDAPALASTGALLLAALNRAGHRLGLGAGLPEAAITLDTHHLVLRAVPRHPHLMLHAVLDKSVSNLTLTRLQIQRMDELFDDH